MHDMFCAWSAGQNPVDMREGTPSSNGVRASLNLNTARVEFSIAELVRAVLRKNADL